MRERAPAYLAGAAAVTTPVSIAASQVLLGLAVMALALDRRKLRWPPVTLPLLLFMGWTLLSLVASPDPRGGLPHIKKFYVYLMLVAVFSGLRTLREVRWVAWGWIVGGSLSALWAMGQGYQIYRATDRFLYFAYSNGTRITGFMGHWMTFSGITMMALLMTGAMFLFEAPRRDKRYGWWLLACMVLLGLGVIGGWQRSYWAGTAIGAMWLLWSRKPWFAAVIPTLAVVLLIVNPLSIRDHAMALFQPQPGVLNSTQHRAVLRATGWEMIKAHRLLGVGPQQTEARFYDYAPPDVPHPVPEGWSIQHLHNLYFQYAAERGIPALLALLWFLGRALHDFVRHRHLVQPGRWVLEGAIACVLGMMVAGWGEVNLGDSEPLAMFLSIVACGYVVIQAPQSLSKPA